MELLGHQNHSRDGEGLLGGSWVVMSRVISSLRRVISIATLLRTRLVTTHEPPSRRVTTRTIVRITMRAATRVTKRTTKGRIRGF